jgi:predicted histidine transporter YuiF (NhaC family)
MIFTKKTWIIIYTMMVSGVLAAIYCFFTRKQNYKFLKQLVTKKQLYNSKARKNVRRNS